MELGSYNIRDKNQSCSKGKVTEHDQQDASASHNPIPTEQHYPFSSVEVNMEVPISADEVMKAGGFGAVDNISSILPAASDFTDFEDRIHDARRYEGSEDEIAGGQSDFPKIKFVAGKANTKEGAARDTQDTYATVNMEAYVSSDDVMRAGGFGATDNISSFLPVASDFTDFEENLRDARAYEESQEKSNRPGLGWRNETK